MSFAIVHVRFFPFLRKYLLEILSEKTKKRKKEKKKENERQKIMTYTSRMRTISENTFDKVRR